MVTKNQIEIHPTAELLPRMDDETFDGLVASISADGQQEPVVYQNGVLLDGRNRVAACNKLEISCDSRGLPGRGHHLQPPDLRGG